MIAYPPFKLKGDNCQCRACGLLFRRTSTFDKHRVGKVGAERRCLTAEELKAMSWFQDSAGFWKRPSAGTCWPRSGDLAQAIATQLVGVDLATDSANRGIQ